MAMRQLEQGDSGRGATPSYRDFVLLKKLGVDLLADKLGPDKVLLGHQEPHLLQDEVHLLPPFHGAKGLHLQPLKDVSSLGNLSLVFTNLGEEHGEAGALDFHIDLALCHLQEGVNQGQLDLQVGRLLDVRHGLLDHLRDGLLELTPLLREQHNLLIQRLPILSLKAQSHCLHQHPRGGCKIRSLCEKGKKNGWFSSIDENKMQRCKDFSSPHESASRVPAAAPKPP